MLPALAGETLIDSASSVISVDPAVVVPVDVVPEVAANTPVLPVETPNSDSNSRRVHVNRLIKSWAPGGTAGGLALWTRLSKDESARVTIAVAAATGLATLFAVGIACAAATVAPGEADEDAVDAATPVASPATELVARPVTSRAEIDRCGRPETRDFAIDAVVERDPDRPVLDSRGVPGLDEAADSGRVARELRPTAELPCDDEVADGECASPPVGSACAVPIPAMAVPIPNASAKPPTRPMKEA